MLQKDLFDRVGEKPFFCAYILRERLKKPEEREFGEYLDLLPKTFNNYPIFFDDEELSYL